MVSTGTVLTVRKIQAAMVALVFASAMFVSAAKAPTADAVVNRCRARAGGLFPDHRCTPGVTSPFVSQENISGTICVRGYTKTVRPSASYTTALKRKQIKQYGYSDTNPSDYEEDHLISLELGGAPTDPRNLWPERGASPNPKDRVENQLRAAVCAHQITLAEAQDAIRTNWRTV
jgi:hypothetical protein